MCSYSINIKGGDILDLKEHVTNIVNQYSNMVYKLALARTKDKADAEDVFQEVFIRYMKNYQKIVSDEHCKAWLIRTTINCSYDIFKSPWLKKTVPMIDNLVFSTEERSNVYCSVLELPKKYRTVIHLFYYEDMSIKEIAEALGIKEGTVKSQLHRGRNMLKESLKGEIDYV